MGQTSALCVKEPCAGASVGWAQEEELLPTERRPAIWPDCSFKAAVVLTVPLGKVLPIEALES